MVRRREVEWSHKSEIRLFEILKFFNERNKNNIYSQKLYKRFKAELRRVAKLPELGIKTHLKGVRGLIVEDYIVFYQILEDKILVLSLWDCRQDPDMFEMY